jgi:hypothetical protein
MGAFNTNHLMDAIHTEPSLKEAEAGKHALEVRRSLVTFHYQNEFGTGFAQYVIQKADPNAWKDIRAAFCLPLIDRNTFTFKFGVKRGGLIK